MDNILQVTEGIIVHQVNCQGVMGCGLALALRNKWPIVYIEYKEMVHNAKTKSSLLGKTQLVKIRNNLYVANMFAQCRYGRDKRYTDYEAFMFCLVNLILKRTYYHLNLDIYFPYKIGCGNAGGNWNTIKTLIKNTIPKAIIVRKN